MKIIKFLFVYYLKRKIVQIYSIGRCRERIYLDLFLYFNSFIFKMEIQYEDSM